MIDWTITVGNLLQVAAFLIAGVGAFFALRGDIRILRHDMRSIQLVQEAHAETMTHVATTLTTVATQAIQINQLIKTVDEMRHGQGYVNPIRV